MIRVRGTCRPSNRASTLVICSAPSRIVRVFASDGSSSSVSTLAKFSSASYLTQAAKRYAAGLAAGIDADELVALELGAPNLGALTPLQLQYKDKIQEKLEQRAAELKKEEADEELRLSRNLTIGKKHYEHGNYPQSVAALEQAVKDVGPQTARGGEAQLWLALAYQACGRDDDAIELYKSVERDHPSRKVQKQAYELRYIAEAPKLPLGEDEKVTIPLLQSEIGRRKGTYVAKYTPVPVKKADKAKETYWDRFDWRAPSGPRLLGADKWYYRVAWLLLALGTVFYVNWSLVQSLSS